MRESFCKYFTQANNMLHKHWLHCPTCFSSSIFWEFMEVNTDLNLIQFNVKQPYRLCKELLYKKCCNFFYRRDPSLKQSLLYLKELGLKKIQNLYLKYNFVSRTQLVSKFSDPPPPRLSLRAAKALLGDTLAPSGRVLGAIWESLGRAQGEPWWVY